MDLAIKDPNIIEEQRNICNQDAKEIADHYRSRGGFRIFLSRSKESILSCDVVVIKEDKNTIDATYTEKP